MKFTPLSDNQIKQASLPPEGQHKFKVVRAVQCTSQMGGLDYFSLRLNVLCGDKTYSMFDNLYFEGSMMYKTKHFFESTGNQSKYESGNVNAQECDNLEGHLEVIHKVSKKTGELQAWVKDYIIKPTEQTISSPKNDYFDDDIPNFA